MGVSPNPDIHKQILRELSFNSECRSPYIVNYYGAYLEDGDSQIAICMEYGEGGSLDSVYKQIKRRNGRTGEKILGKIAEAVLKGLVYLHDRKIIHRGAS
jgi:mitogen-activated protein kinase kinase